ncbi:MAG: DUF6273 domain-containing protein [Propionibacteriaceae bacterium]|jgi:hypothetical protein|nr:DUF6273 domain-containing protein [Propionibacteriaceae bacterium]
MVKVLSRNEAQAVVESLSTLRPLRRRHSQEIVDLMDDSGKVDLADAMNRLFDDISPESARRNIERRIDAFNAAAEGLRSPVRMVLSTLPEHGRSRWLRLEMPEDQGPKDPLIIDFRDVSQRIVADQYSKDVTGELLGDGDSPLASSDSGRTRTFRPFPTAGSGFDHNLYPTRRSISENSRVQAIIAGHPLNHDASPERDILNKLNTGYSGIQDFRFRVESNAQLTSVDVAQPVVRSRQADEETDARILDVLLRWATDDRSEPFFILLGDYGMGKTLTSQKFACDLLEMRRQGRITRWPLYFDLRHVAITPGRLMPTLDEVMVECARTGWKRSGDITADEIWGIIDQGAIIIFDGLDEVLSKRGMNTDIEFARRLLSVFDQAEAGNPSVKVMLTTRIQYFRTLFEQREYLTLSGVGDKSPNRFQAWELLGLSPVQIRRYLEKSLPDRDVDRVAAMLARIHDLTDLSQRPYTLSLITKVIPEIESMRDEGRIFGSTLYRRFALQWLARDSQKSTFSVEHKMELAENMAVRMSAYAPNSGLVYDYPGVRVEDLKTWLVDWIENRPGWNVYKDESFEKLDEDLRNSTFLSRFDGDDVWEGYYNFAHTSLREFFLSEYLLRALHENDPKRWVIPVPTSETLVFLGQSIAEVNARQRQETPGYGRRFGEDRQSGERGGADRPATLTDRLSEWMLGAWNDAESPATVFGDGRPTPVTMVNDIIVQYGILARQFDLPALAELCPILPETLQSHDHGSLPAVKHMIRRKTFSMGSRVTLDGKVWKVIDRREVIDGAGGAHRWQALLVSEFVVDFRPYHDEGGEVVWKDCSLRRWLNGEFYDSLSEDMRKSIDKVLLKNASSRASSTDGGPDTEDHIFLLSADDLRSASYSSLIGKDGVVTRPDGMPCWWWLRSPGEKPDQKAVVYRGGWILDEGKNTNRVNFDFGGVLPALWLNLDT